MKILVTGCAGFIGFHLTRNLLRQGHEVTGVDNLNDYYSSDLKIARLTELGIDRSGINYNTAFNSVSDKFTLIMANIEDAALYIEHLNDIKFDVVCHLAAQAGVRYSMENPAQYVSSNIVGFFNLLEYCRHNPVKRLVFASSSSVYGNNDSMPYKESDRTDSPVSFYGATKKANEIMAHSYASLYDISTIGLRFFTVYGPWGRPDMAPFIFTKSIIEGEPINVFNNGDMARDFTYIDDIVEGICKVLIEKPKRPMEKHDFRIYNIGNSHPVELNDFISTLERITGKEAYKNYLPMQPGDVLRTWADTTMLKEDYDYTPSTPLEKGLADFVEWYEQYYKISAR